MQPDAIAIAPGLARVGCDRRQLAQTGAGERFRKDRPLHRELLRIRGVLVLAAAARTIERAAWRDPFRGRLKHAEQIRLGKTAPLPPRRGFDRLTGQRHGHEHGFAVDSRQAGAAINSLFDRHPHSSLRM